MTDLPYEEPNLLRDGTSPNVLIKGHVLSISTRGKVIESDLVKKWPFLSKFHLHESLPMGLLGANNNVERTDHSVISSSLRLRRNPRSPSSWAWFQHCAMVTSFKLDSTNNLGKSYLRGEAPTHKSFQNDVFAPLPMIWTMLSRIRTLCCSMKVQGPLAFLKNLPYGWRGRLIFGINKPSPKSIFVQIISPNALMDYQRLPNFSSLDEEKRMVSSENCKWLILSAEFLTLEPSMWSESSPLANILLRQSTTKVYKNGEKGSPEGHEFLWACL